jgi:capsular polysaccharide biosynthesis protein/Mrp family chromosome partitioning ATPase
VLRQAWLVAIALAAVIASAGFLLWTQGPVYRASMKIVVGQGGGVFQPDAGGAVDSFTQTMTNLLESRVVAQTVIDRMGLVDEQGRKANPETLLDNVGVSSQPQSAVLSVTYESGDRGQAVGVLNEIGRVFAGLVAQRLGGESAPARGRVSATVFDPARADSDPVLPRPGRTLVIAVLLGLIIGILLAVAREMLDTRVYGIAEAATALGAPVVGALPRRLQGKRALALGRGRRSPAPGTREAPDSLAANVRLAQLARGERVIVVTSAVPGEGRTTVAANLGVALASAGDDVICVEADARSPTLGARLGARPAELGLIDVLRGRTDLEGALVDLHEGAAAESNQDDRKAGAGSVDREVPRSPGANSGSPRPGNDGARLVDCPACGAVAGAPCVGTRGQERGSAHPQRETAAAATLPRSAEPAVLGAVAHRSRALRLLPIGGAGSDPGVALSADAAGSVTATLRDAARYVVIDAPPLLRGAGAFPLVLNADAVIVVARDGSTKTADARVVRALLEGPGGENVCVVLTSSNDVVPEGWPLLGEGSSVRRARELQS